MALKLKLIREHVSLKVCYDDCTVEDLDRIGPRTCTNLLLALSTASPETIEELNVNEQIVLMDFFEFLNKTEGLNVFVPKTNIEIGEESFSKVEQAKQLVAANPENYAILPGLCRIYMGDAWITANNKNISVVYSHGLQLLSNFKAFLERHEDLKEPGPMDPQLAEDLEEAGEDVLDQFGVFKVIYTICDGKPWKYKQLLDSPAEDVYLTLRYAKAKAWVEKHLADKQKFRASIK